jgi:hypothetical protein
MLLATIYCGEMPNYRKRLRHRHYVECKAYARNSHCTVAVTANAAATATIRAAASKGEVCVLCTTADAEGTSHLLVVG